MGNGIKGRGVLLAVGTVVLLFAGIIYAWSIMKVPFINDFGWNESQLGVNYTFLVAFFCIGTIVAGRLGKITTPAFRLDLGGILFCIGFIIVSQMEDNIAVLYGAYGILGGFGIGLVYITTIGVVNSWFPDKIGLSSGIILMGFGLNSLTIGKLANYCFDAPGIGWRTTYLVLGIVTAVVCIIASFVLKPVPEGTIFPPAKNEKNKSVVENDFTPLQMVKRPSFWKLMVFYSLLASVGSVSISFAKDIMLDTGTVEAFAITMVGIVSIGNGAGRLFSGWLFDRIGLAGSKYVTSILAVVATLLVAFALQIQNSPLAYIGLFLCYLSFGFVATGLTAFTTAFYGQKNFSLNFGILNLHLIATAFSSAIAGSLKVVTGSFILIFLILSGLSAFVFLLSLTIKKP